MMGTVSDEIFIPAGEARGFIVRRGDTFRLLQVEGEQVADAVFFNANFADGACVNNFWNIFPPCGFDDISSAENIGFIHL